jgi:hypothetical protein
VRFHRLIAATATWLVLVCTLASAHAEKRVALVVGNAAYRYTDKLDNPVNDAQAMASRPSPFCRSGEAIASGDGYKRGIDHSREVIGAAWCARHEESCKNNCFAFSRMAYDRPGHVPKRAIHLLMKLS